MARLAQSVERKALNLVVMGSSPTVGEFAYLARPKIFDAHHIRALDSRQSWDIGVGQQSLVHLPTSSAFRMPLASVAPDSNVVGPPGRPQGAFSFPITLLLPRHAALGEGPMCCPWGPLACCSRGRSRVGFWQRLDPGRRRKLQRSIVETIVNNTDIEDGTCMRRYVGHCFAFAPRTSVTRTDF